MELSQVLQALRNADAAGDVEGAKRLAQIAQQLASGAEEPPHPKEKEPESGFFPSLKASTETLKGDIAALAGRAGLMNVQEAEEYQKAREAEAQKIYRPTEKGWTESPFTKLGELAGGSLPYMAAPLAAGLLAPEGLAGLAATGAVSATQFAGSNLARQMQEGKTLKETNLSNAALAAVPQAALDVLSLKMIPGIKGIFGEAGTELSNAEAKRIADQGLTKTLGDYALQTGKTAGIEGTTEAAQQVFERLQAGLNLTDPQAREEYFDNFLGGAVLGGALAPAGRFMERSKAKGQAAQVQQEEQKKQQIQAIKDQQTADAQEEQRKQDPAYMQMFVQNYEALQDQYKDLQKQTKKPDMKTAVPADIEQYNQNREQLAEMRKKLTADSQEYLQLRPAYNQIRAQQQAQAQQAEDQRYQQMETETAQNQPTADTAYYQSPQGTLPGIQPAIDPTTGEPVAQAPEKVDTRALYDRLQILQRAKDAHQQQESEIAASGDMKALGEFFKQKDTVDKAYKDTAKQLKEAGGYEPAPKHPAVVAQDAYNKAAAELQEKSKAGTFGYDPEVARKLYAKVEAAQNNLDSVIAEHGPAPRGHEQEGFDFGPESKFPELTQESIPDFVKRRNDALVAERKKQAELYEQKIRPEIQGIQRIASRRDEGPTIFGQLPQMEEAPKKGFGSAAMGQMQQNLEGIEPGTDLIHTAEETQARNAEKSPTEPYRGLYASPTEEPEFTRERKEEMRADLERRLASVMSRYEMPQGTYDMLRRAENALAVPNPDTDFMRTLDEQLKEIESGREGMPRKGAALPTEDLRAFPLGETAVYKRFSKEAGEAGRPILRGASAKPAPLSRQAELEEHLRTSEAARGEGPIKEKQLPLFPGETPNLFPETGKTINLQEELGTVRANPAQFQRFLNSDKVKKLRLALDKDLNELQKLDVIDQLKTRADALAKEVNAMESVNLEYGQAQRTLRHQRDVGKQRYDVNQLRQAMFSGIIRRMGLQNKLDELKKAKNEIDAEARANHIGGWDGFDPDLHANLEHMHEEYQRAVNEMAEMQGALSTLEGRLKVEEAKIKIAKLNPLTTPKDTLAAAKEELNAARFDLGEAQKTANAELVANKAEEGKQRRADEAVAKAKADKIRDDIAKERQERLEAAYNPATRGVEYPAILDAQRMAKELPAQERQPTTNAEEQAIRGNPMKVLGGYKSDVRKLEKKIQQSQTQSKNARLEGLSELRNKADALNKQYKESATAAERAELLPKLEAAETAYDEEVNKLVDQPITWIGMAKDIRDLAVAINRADRLETRIESGDVEIQGVLPAKQRKAPHKNIKRAEKTVNGIKDKIAVEKDEAEKAKLEKRLANAEKFLVTAKAEEAQRNTQAAKAAQETAGAAKTTEPALTKSEVKKATKQGNTVYTSKGVGEEIQTKIAKEVKSKEIVENENKYKALKAKKPSTLNAMEKAFIQMYDYKYGGKSSGLADEILAEDKKNIEFSRGSTNNPSTVSIVNQELKKHFKDLNRIKIYSSVEALIQGNPQYKNRIPSNARGFVDTAGNKVFLIAENINQGQALGVLLHEVGAHVGLKNILGEEQYNTLSSTVESWAKRNDNSIESRIAKEAIARVKEAKTPAHQRSDEILAYAVEEAVKAGVTPNKIKGVLGEWLSKIADSFRKLLQKFGMRPESLDAQGLVDMAFGAAQMEMQPVPSGMSRRAFLRGAVAAVGGMHLPAVNMGMSLDAKAKLFNATLDAADSWFSTVLGMAKTPALRNILKEYSFSIDNDAFAEALYNADPDIEGKESLYAHLHWASYGPGDSTESLIDLLESKPDAVEKLQAAVLNVRSQLVAAIDKLPKKENGEIAENELPEVGELLFSSSEPPSKPITPIPVKTLRTFGKNAPALKPASKPLQRLITPEIAKSLTKEDFEKLAETRYGTSITHDHPVNGMTFEEAALHGAKKTTSPMVKQLFNALAEVFKHAPVLDGSGRVYTVNDPIKTNKGRALGIYSTSLDAVYLHAEPNGSKSFNKVLLHELTHAATVRAMYLKPELMKQMDDLRTKAIAWLQTPEGKKYFRNHSMGLGKTRESIYGLRNAKEFVAEVFANREFQKLLSEIPSDKPRKSIFTRLVEALSKFFDMPAKAAQSLFAEAISLSEDVMNVTREQIYEGKVGPLAFAPEEDISPFIAPKYNTEAFARVGNIADKFIAKEKTLLDKVKANATGLAVETQLVDRFAGFERLSKTMDELKGHQMMFYLRMYDQRMNFVSQSASNGALGIAEKTRADGRKEYLIESKPGPSLKSTVEILKEASPLVGNGEAVNRLFTLYMSAIRAKDKGFEALHFGNNLTEAELNQAKATIDATPELKDIFDRARHEYNTYNRNQLEFAAQAGAISKDVVARLLKENDYIPWYRQRNGVAELVIGSETPIRVGSIAEQPYLQELVGGDTPILDFMTSSVQNTNMLADMGLRNLATKNAVFELVDMDLAHISKKKLAGADVVKFKVDGEDRYAIIDTDKVGIPADILVKGMEGIPAQMPFAFRVMGIPAKLLRKVVTASPLYAAKQLFRDSLAATILSGADFTPVMGSLKEINSATKATLEQRGITGGQIFTGTNEDLSKILKDIVNNKPGWLNSLSKWEAMSMEADATTRRAQYNSYIQQGLSEMEATLMSLESMNFNKRGASPSVHIINSLIPFFNAQIQSLNVLYKALTGKLPFNEKLKIQEKLLVRGAMLAAGTLAYTMMMQDDDAYKNATPDQKYNNWFVRVPGVDEPVRLPIPFEIGYIFKALPEALYNTMVNKHGKEEAVEAFSGIMKNLIPGGSSYGIPQALKPAIEAGLGKSFYTGRDILTKTEQNLLPEDQFRANTTEAAKAFGKATGTSPIIMEELVRGYTGTLGLAFLQAVSMGVPKGDTPEQTAGRLSELPVVGGAFQPNDAGGIISSVYKRMDDIKKVANTVDERLSKGQKAEALDLIHRTGNAYAASEVADYYTSTMKDLTSYENAIRASNMTGEQKREKLDYIRQMKIKFANSVRNATDKIALQ